MRKLIVIASLFCLVSIVAQGNLQFNQVLLLSSSTNNLSQWTVPQGKTWKIEAIGGNQSYISVYLNNQYAFEYHGGGGSSGANIAYLRHSSSSPVWLPAGTVLGHSGNYTNNFRWFSIIEFNIVP